MPQIIDITSEALQATIRRLLPSQRGFGLDLQASNVITPIIDLTPTAEGSILPSDLQQSYAYGSNTGVIQGPGTSTLISNSGFWHVKGTVGITGNAAADASVAFRMNDGSTDKVIQDFSKNTASSLAEFFIVEFDQKFFLRAGDSVKVTVTGQAYFIGNYRQLADVNGNLIDPSGFTSE